MDLLTKLKGLRALGLDNVFRSFVYATHRDRAERKHIERSPSEREPTVVPGSLLQFHELPHGARCRFGNATLEVHFLASDLVRITWQPGALPVGYALVQRAWNEPAVRHRRRGSTVRELGTDELTIQIERDGSLSMYDADGRLVRSEDPPWRLGSTWVYRAGLQAEEAIYGLGERTATLNLRGGRFRLWNREPMGSYGPGDDPIYLCIPVVLGLQSRGCYLLFFENSYDGEMAFEERLEAHFAGGALRYYLTVGSLDQVYRRYAELTGVAPLPPRWALGYHQCRWSYGSEKEVRELADGFRRHDLPLGAIHLDIHYMDGYRAFTVDPERFADLARLSEDLLTDGVRLVAIIGPGVKVDPSYRLYREGTERSVFCKLPSGKPVKAPAWPGWCLFPDFTDPEARDWWAELYAVFDEWGIAGVWHDMNEPAAFAPWREPTLPLPTRHDFDGRGGDHREAHNLYALLEARAGDEGLRRHRPGHRPWILSRSGWAGMQRYAWNWAGGCESTWWNMHQSVRIALSMGLSGVPYTGPDIGGFGGKPSAELYVRWFQLAAFLPFFRTHSATFVPRREPWSFGEQALGIVRDFLKLRYRLMPYLYTLAWEVSRTGHPFVRPLFWLDSGNRRLREVDDQFLLGDALLVAPIVTQGAHSRRVVLPAGDWYHFWDDRLFAGPDAVELQAPLERIPILVRAGSILPMADGEGRLVLHIYPTADHRADGLLYEDAGDGYGPSRVDRFALGLGPEGLRLTRKSEGAFSSQFDDVLLCPHGFAPSRLAADGTELALEEGLAKVGPFDEVIFELEG